jgi:alkanesulfonate monooxygenase SsuD/methylene tetrahydromethanopterin reductase-like flavin-dependent oxidoreductase (luciferase family)
MWKDGVYSYEGTYFRVPERQVFPKPHGPAHPAMWVAAGSPPTFTEAGEMGLGAFCFSMGAPAHIAPLVANYKNAIGNATPVGDYVNDNIMGVTNMLCMEDRTRAFETAADMQMNYYTSLAYHWLDNIPKPKGLPEWPDRIPEPSPEGVEKLAADGYAIIGDPDDCAKALRRWEEIGVDQLTFSPTTNTLPTDVVAASMELFGREVIPQFDTDPVHSTTRYRQAAATTLRPAPQVGLRQPAVID